MIRDDCDLELGFIMTAMFEGETVPRPPLRCWGWMELGEAYLKELNSLNQALV